MEQIFFLMFIFLGSPFLRRGVILINRVVHQPVIKWVFIDLVSKSHVNGGVLNGLSVISIGSAAKLSQYLNNF